MSTKSTLSIVIPACNEEKTLEVLVRKVLDLNLPFEMEKEIIIVNDCSKDKTGEIIEKLRSQYFSIKTLHNEKNVGKSRTVRNGILSSTGDYVVIQDADLEYEPNELSIFVEKIVTQKLDVVYGDRFGKKNEVIYWINYIGNKGITFVSNLYTFPRIKTWIPDMENCYKMVKGDIIRELAKDFTATSNFGFEPEVTAKLSLYKKDGKHLKFGIVPVSYFPRSVAEGKHMKAFSDGWKALKEIIRYNSRRS
jgi:glycosyltransferase involved in cell wall biosynthesis